LRAPAPAAADRGPLGPPLDLDGARSMRAAVHQRLREAILDVRLLPGAALSENDIAHALQVSRTPVREALQRLANEGLIQVVPQVGTYVARMDLARIREALFMREAIEHAAALRLARRLPAEALDALDRIVAAHRAAVRGADVTAILAADEAFHRRLLEEAGMPGVWRYVLEAREMHRRVRVLARVQYDAARHSVAQHAAIVTELRAGRPGSAATLLRDHIRMNARLAEDMAKEQPHFFTARTPVAPSGEPGATPRTAA
jgi:DNA-binding GntR family transcriptional regulator